MVYLFIFTYLILGNILFSRLDNKGLLEYKFLLVVLVLVAGFRYKIGIDTYSYTLEYENFPTLFQLTYSFIEDSRYQVLWILFESTIRTISSSFYLLQLVLALFVNFVVFRFIRIYSLHPFLTVLFYFLLFYLNLNMEILRESVSICFLLIGIDFLLKKKFVGYYILAVIAYFFHESGFILFIIPPLLQLKWTKKSYFLLIISFFFISEFIFFYFLELISSMNYFFYSEKLDYFEYQEVSIGTRIFMILKYVITPSLILFGLFNSLKEIERNYILAYILFSILCTQSFIFYRIRDYVFILFLVAVTNCFVRFDKRFNKSFVRTACSISFLFIFLFRFYYYSGNPHQLYLNYYPYNFILDEEIPESRIENFNKIWK